ncbi:hypothetical protein IFR04_010611 [Cadophora malorum]|uniref:Uncharacterized protein n=1 Tax=Cadophora malorum TaxID=108018 RepID=A0A8H7T7I9_9HELO|nr:hypothetical protein IFR04_010611 [Cadophora malorum]
MSSPSPEIINNPAPVCPECLAKDANYAEYEALVPLKALQPDNVKKAEYRLSLINEKLELTTEKLDLTEKLNEKLKERISLLLNAKVVETLEEELYRLRERLAEADRIVQALPTKKEHHERKKENDRLKKEVKALQKQQKAFDEAAMPSKKKFQG